MALSADDRLAILELDARYCHAADDTDVAALLALFTDDGIERGGVLIQGREGLAALAAQLATSHRLLRHWTSAHVAEGEGDRATHRCAWLTTRLTEGGLAIAGVGRYEDELVRTADGWRFRVRRIRPDWVAAPAPRGAAE